MRVLFAVFTSLFLFISCEKKEHELIRKLADDKRSLVCKMERLKLQSDSLWDQMESFLDQNLPIDMPPAERKNMVAIRNANLITMFKAFPKLDTMIQRKVKEAEATDRMIADDMKSVMEQLHKSEKDMNDALQKVEDRNERDYQNLKQELQKFENIPCDSFSI